MAGGRLPVLMFVTTDTPRLTFDQQNLSRDKCCTAVPFGTARPRIFG